MNSKKYILIDRFIYKDNDMYFLALKGERPAQWDVRSERDAA